MGAGFRTQVVRDLPSFQALASDWARLYSSCPTATPFQSHAWLAAWAGAYAGAGRLRVVLVRSAGRLVAAAPLVLTRRGPWPVLTPMGGEITDFVDVLLAPDAGPAVGEALTAALLDVPGWRVVDLPELLPGAAALTWAGSWPGRVTRLPSSVSLELPAGPLPELLDRLPSRTASGIRRKLRKVDALGVEVATVPPDAGPQGVAALLRLHEEQWRGRAGNPEHLRPRFREHLTAALPQMIADGQAHLVEYRVDGELVASQIDLVGHDLFGYYLAGVSPELRERIDVASMLVRQDVERAVAAGLPRYSMLRGQEDYKFRWRPETVQHQRLLLGRPGPLGGAGHPWAASRRVGALRWAKEQGPWVLRVRDRLVRLRPRRRD